MSIKNIFYSKFFLVFICMLLFIPILSFAAPEDDVNVDEETTISEVLDENSKEVEEESIPAPQKDTSVSGIVGPDGAVYTGKIFINITTEKDENSSIPSGTSIIVKLKSATGGITNSKTELNISNSYSSVIELPVDNYSITYTAYVDGKENSDIILNLIGDDKNFIDVENNRAWLLENAQELKFSLSSNIKVQNPEEQPETVVEPEKTENFWMKLLKHNILFIALFLGCGIFLLVYRLSHNKYR